MLTDGQLLERFAARRGDPSELAFAALVERHGSMVLRVARGVTNDEHSAHDAFQATFLILARKARSLWVRDSLGPWLHGVAYRVAAQNRLMEQRRKRRERGASRPEVDRSEPPDRADVIRAIHEEIDRLPQPFRLAVVTCHLEGLTQQDAAERLGWPVGTLQSRLARGRQKLRDRLERRGLNPSMTILTGPMAAVPHVLTTTTARAAVVLNLGKSITGIIAPTVLAMTQATMKGMFMTKLKLGTAAVLMAVGGIVGTGMAVGVGQDVHGTDDPPAQNLPSLPKPASAIPRPGDSLVKIRVERAGQPTIRLSGTMIQSTAAETLILTSSRGFGGIRFIDGRFQAEILVDLFGSPEPKIAGHAQTNLSAQFVDIDTNQELTLLRIKPGRVLPTARVANESWNPIRGNKLLAVADSTGAEPTLLETVMVNPLFPHYAEGRQPAAGSIRNVMKTTRTSQPANPPRAVGGGLFTTDGALGGVYLGSGPEETGLYVRPDAIRDLLDRRGLAALYQQDLVPVPNDKPDVPTTEVEPKLEPLIEPSLNPSANPKPWETVVRIKMHFSDKEWGFGSGTVISSTPEESIILTCGHIFRVKGMKLPNRTKDFNVPITVDLFNGQAASQSPTQLGRDLQDIVGEAIDYDFDNDVGLIRIRPGKQLPVSRVVPTHWKPKKGMKMTTVGCSQGADATAWNTTILDPDVTMTNSATKKTFHEIKCQYQPKEGRAGGGLFTSDGYVAGVCDFADPNEHVGLYAVPDAIHKLLDRNDLTSLYRDKAEPELTKADPSLTPVPPLPPAFDLAFPASSKPAETTVRIKSQLNDKGGWQIGAGTVISSTPDESIILTCHHLFRLGDRPQPAPQDYPRKVRVEVFNDPVLQRQSRAEGKPLIEELVGEVIDYDFDNGLGLIRVKPGRPLAFSRVVASDWQAKKGMRMTTVGTPLTTAPMTWETTILDPRVRTKNHETKSTGFEISCNDVPKDSWFGGGLFTAEGQLAGVYNWAGHSQGFANYAVPDAIHTLLDRNGLAALYQGRKSVKVTDVDIHGFKYPAPADLLAQAGHQSSRSQPLPFPGVLDSVGRDGQPVPKPWQTAARIWVHESDTSRKPASGTIIRSTEQESLILLASSSLWVTTKDPQPSAAEFPNKVTVDLFDGSFGPTRTPKLQPAQNGLPAEVVAIDHANRVALLRIRPGKRLFASPLVAPDWEPREGLNMISIGCSNGNSATVWGTTILNPNYSVEDDQLLIRWISCSHLPANGREGGGLFTNDGQLAGVCSGGDDFEHIGLYIRPEAIRRLLDQQGLPNLNRVAGPANPALKHDYQDVVTSVNKNPDGRILRPGSTDQNPLLKSKLYRPTPGDRQVGLAPPMPDEGVPTEPQSDDQRRITDLEKKLDQVLQALEGLKGKANPE